MAIIRLAVQHDKTEKHILPMFSVFQNVFHGIQKEETMKLHFQIQLAALFMDAWPLLDSSADVI